ncbi:MAG: CoB--CoM heterodisulfide reductase iron-sulfur subunit B family protein [Actinobacteria bacterium]|nr:CoB--CoM heterodisulfide reductase iron-sulfur subunit B family protein [Actinomycetota bacterium]MBU4240721.1 CoB--CoM heterodisulfide reductase iron-sulfur subunit B family protein [Actinomycetota bacterium]MBU4301893.1 CoB--CoM heterodisulfide reductase iron-sulfur subunit B family protein [Actinomycetota bacterium]MBU4385591.1 CoB--CoM heterodisulfide reductase iron-sulfur subunit B family protein [Actinomycetota bacterium]MCG2795793.1 CoB--CoM heterodisulfide reductase iron-sulfur subun
MTDLAFSYFPGCSQSGSAEEFGLSTEAVCRALGIELLELPDWNCCGASSAHMTDDLLSITLPGRDLAIAREAGRDMLTVCVMCYSRMKIAQARISGDEELAREVEEVVGADPRFNGEVRHLLDVLVNDVGFPEIKKWLRLPLAGLRAVPYYGCLLVRPPEVCCCDSVENPTDLDRLLTLLGADVRRWSFKTDCCGGSLSLSRTDIVEKMVNNLLTRAEEAGANCVVTVCPICAANLEMRQKPGKLAFKVLHDVPVLYFTELLGLAMGLSGVEEWMKSHIIDPMPLMREAKLLTP